MNPRRDSLSTTFAALAGRLMTFGFVDEHGHAVRHPMFPDWPATCRSKRSSSSTTSPTERRSRWRTACSPPMPRRTRRRSAGLHLRSKGRGKCSSASVSPWPRHQRHDRSTRHDGKSHRCRDAVSRRIRQSRTDQEGPGARGRYPRRWPSSTQLPRPGRARRADVSLFAEGPLFRPVNRFRRAERPDQAQKTALGAFGAMSWNKTTALYPGPRRAEHDTTSQPVFRCRPRRSCVCAPHPPRKMGLRALGVDFQGMPLLPHRTE